MSTGLSAVGIIMIFSIVQNNQCIALFFAYATMLWFGWYNEIIKIDGKIKICFITAFDIQKDENFDSIIKSADKDKPVVIRKPIDIEELVKRIKKIIPTSI